MTRMLSRLLIGAVGLLFAFAALADPPGRAGRLGYAVGQVSFSPAGEDEWAQAVVNRPLTTGDRLWADADGRAELQVGSAVVRMSANTSMTLLNLDDDTAQIELAQGTLHLRVRRLDASQTVEVDTPNLAFTVRQAGEYRIDVDPSGSASVVVVRSGLGDVYGDGASYTVNARQAYRFAGSGLTDYEAVALPQPDDFERWAGERDRRSEVSVSARYVSRDVVGYEELDDNGSWQTDPEYGRVWAPTRVAVDWAPYRDGHWAWVEPWGWTWVDDAPWGYAVSHYGRWAHSRSRWVWVPGPIRARPVYAPALVAFVGGNNFKLSISVGAVGGVAWFPLAPREVYRPSYTVSRPYFERVNVSNTVIHKNVNITNVYNNVNVTKVVYVNQKVKGAVVAVPTASFQQSQPVAKARVKVSDDVVVKASVTSGAAIAPVRVSVTGTAQPGKKPPATVTTRVVVAKTAPPPQKVSFEVKKAALERDPGKPLDEKALAAVRPATPAAQGSGPGAASPAAPRVKVVKAEAPATAPPPKNRAAASAPQGQASAPQARSAQAAQPQAAAASRPGARDKPDNAAAARPAEPRTPAASAPGERGNTAKRAAATASGAVARPPKASASAPAVRRDAASAAAARRDAASAPAARKAARPPAAAGDDRAAPPARASAPQSGAARPPSTARSTTEGATATSRAPADKATAAPKARPTEAAPETVRKPPVARATEAAEPRATAAPKATAPRTEEQAAARVERRAAAASAAAERRRERSDKREQESSKP